MIWTALEATTFDNPDAADVAQRIAQYLGTLTGAVRDYAERYVRFAPRQIDTPVRRKIEAALGWTAVRPGEVEAVAASALLSDLDAGPGGVLRVHW